MQSTSDGWAQSVWNRALVHWLKKSRLLTTRVMEDQDHDCRHSGVWTRSVIIFILPYLTKNWKTHSLVLSETRLFSHTITDQTYHQLNYLDTELDLELWVVSMEHLQRVWRSRRERLPFQTPGSVRFRTCLCSDCWDQFFPNLPFHFPTFNLEYPSVLSQYCIKNGESQQCKHKTVL